MECGRGFLDVDRGWGKLFIDEIRNFAVCVRFGFQPNATASGRSGTEIEQYGTILCGPVA
jgi:hypothetical protein